MSGKCLKQNGEVKDSDLVDEAMKLLTLSHVPRWAIIDTTKRQSVGNHTFRVMVLVRAIAQFVIGYEVFVDLGNLLTAALLHDVDECESGDIPTPYKHSKSSSVTVGTMQSASVEELVVKLADTMESVIFLSRYGVKSKRIESEIRDKVYKYVEGIMYMEPNLAGNDRLMGFVHNILNSGGDYE